MGVCSSRTAPAPDVPASNRPESEDEAPPSPARASPPPDPEQPDRANDLDFEPEAPRSRSQSASVTSHASDAPPNSVSASAPAAAPVTDQYAVYTAFGDSDDESSSDVSSSSDDDEEERDARVGGAPVTPALSVSPLASHVGPSLHDRSLLAAAVDASSLSAAPSFQWNELYQHALDLPPTSPDRDRLLTWLYDNFRATCVQFARVIVSELSLPVHLRTVPPSSSMGGVAGGTKYMVAGILFKIPTDPLVAPGRHLYSASAIPSWELAAKAAGHDLKGANAFHQALAADAHLRVPLQLAIDFLGFRILAMPLLPLSSSSLQYGSSDGGRTVHMGDDAVREDMANVGRELHLAPHQVGRGDQAQTMFTAGDVEGHVTDGGRRYALDFGRMFPPSAPREADHLPRADSGVFYRMLRPEFLRARREAGHPPLNADAFSLWVANEPNRSEHHAHVREATRALLDEVVPAFAAHLAAEVVPRTENTWVRTLTHEAHTRGINMRHLGPVLRHIPRNNESAATVVRAEILKRTLKNLLRQLLRNEALLVGGKGNSAAAASRQAVLHQIVVDFVRLVCELSKDADRLASLVLPSLRERFGKCAGTPPPTWQATLSAHLLHTVNYCLAAVGMRLSADFVSGLDEPANASLANSAIASLDIEEGVPRVKEMHILAHAEATVLLSEAAQAAGSEPAQQPERVASVLRLVQMALDKLWKGQSALYEADVERLLRMALGLCSDPKHVADVINWLVHPALTSQSLLVRTQLFVPVLTKIAEMWTALAETEHTVPSTQLAGCLEILRHTPLEEIPPCISSHVRTHLQAWEGLYSALSGLAAKSNPAAEALEHILPSIDAYARVRKASEALLGAMDELDTASTSALALQTLCFPDTVGKALRRGGIVAAVDIPALVRCAQSDTDARLWESLLIQQEQSMLTTGLKNAMVARDMHWALRWAALGADIQVLSIDDRDKLQSARTVLTKTPYNIIPGTHEFFKAHEDLTEWAWGEKSLEVLREIVPEYLKQRHERPRHLLSRVVPELFKVGDWVDIFHFERHMSWSPAEIVDIVETSEGERLLVQSLEYDEDPPAEMKRQSGHLSPLFSRTTPEKLARLGYLRYEEESRERGSDWVKELSPKAVDYPLQCSYFGPPTGRGWGLALALAENDRVKHWIMVAGYNAAGSEIDLSNSDMQEEDAHSLAVGMRYNKSVTRLCLSGNKVGVTDAFVTQLLASLRSNESDVELSSIDLRSTGVRAQGAVDLAQYALEHPGIRIGLDEPWLAVFLLNLGVPSEEWASWIVGDTPSQISRLFKTDLYQLSFKKKKLVQRDVHAIAQTLSKASGLVGALNLDDNRLGGPSLRALVPYLRIASAPLQELELSSADLDPDAASALASCVAEHASLQTLKLSYNSDFDLAVFARKALAVNTTLKELDVFGRDPHPVWQLEELCVALESNANLALEKLRLNAADTDYVLLRMNDPDFAKGVLKVSTPSAVTKFGCLGEHEDPGEAARETDLIVRAIERNTMVDKFEFKVNFRCAGAPVRLQKLAQALDRSEVISKVSCEAMYGRGHVFVQSVVAMFINDAERAKRLLGGRLDATRVDAQRADAGEWGFAAMAMALAGNSTVTHMNLSGNNLGKDETVAKLGRALMTCTSLQELTMTDIHHTDYAGVKRKGLGWGSGLQAVVSGIARSKTLTMVHLDEDVEALVRLGMDDPERAATVLYHLKRAVRDSSAAQREKTTTSLDLHLGFDRESLPFMGFVRDMLSAATTVRELGLSRNNLGHTSMSLLASALAANTGLETLDLGGNKLDCESVRALFSAPRLPKRLLLKACDLSASLVSEMCAALAHSPAAVPEMIDLSWNKMHVAGLQTIAQALDGADAPLAGLRELKLESVLSHAEASEGLDAAGQEAVTQIVKSLERLELISWHSALDDDGVAVVAEALSAPDSKLIELTLNGCALGAAGCSVLLQAAAQRLEALSFIGCKSLGADLGWLPALQEVLGSDALQLRRLTVRQCQLPPEAGQGLGAALHSCTQLEVLDLKFNKKKLGEHGLADLFAAWSAPGAAKSGMKELYLQYCGENVNVDCATAFAGFLENEDASGRLEVLDWDSAKWPDADESPEMEAAYVRIASAVQQRAALRTLNVEYGPSRWLRVLIPDEQRSLVVTKPNSTASRLFWQGMDARLLVEKLGSHPVLTEVTLATELSEEMLLALAEALRTNTALESLEIGGDTKVSESAAHALVDAWVASEESTHLRKLSLPKGMGEELKGALQEKVGERQGWELEFRRW